MKYLLISLLLIASFGCSEQKEKVEKIVFDARQINSRIIYKHTFYSSGKIKATEQITFMYNNEALIDSLISNKAFTYNTKGQITKVQEDNTTEYRYYDVRDSLIALLSINSFGDTILVDKTKYEKGSIMQKTYKRLAVAFNEDFSKTNLSKYDTIYYQHDYQYFGDTLEICFNRNIKNQLESEIHTQFRNNKKVKATVYTFLGTERYVQNITHYQPSDFDEPDLTTINFSGDTISLQRTFLKDDLRVVANYITEIDAMDYEFYNSKNQLTIMVMINNTAREKIIYEYIYDSYGNLVEEIHFTELVPAS